jgi:hypothetical protein
MLGVKSKIEIRRSLAACAVLLVASPLCSAQQVYVDAPEVAPAENVDPGFSYFVAHQVTVDDNLFRLPSGYTNAAIGAGSAGKRSDRIDQTSAGVDELWVAGRQTVAATVRLSRDDYAFYKFLNNTGWNGNVLWNWSGGSRWTGQLGVNHNRSLLDFAYTRNLAKDIVQSGGYLANTRFQIGPGWAVTASVNKQDINHSLTQSRIFDSRNESGSLGAEYATSASNTIELQYKYAKAEYPDQFASAASIQQNFRESTAQLLLNFQPSDKTVLLANAGYLQRHFADARLATYSGEVWHASLNWQALQKIQLTAAVGRDLQAYVDAATEYFVARDTTLKATWTPREKVTVAVLLDWEHQDYVVGANSAQGFLGRLDTLKNQSVTVGYAPRSWCSFNLSAGVRDRNSNYKVYSFNDNYVTGGIKLTF